MTRLQLAAACALDALLGDPPRWPHPVNAFGALIDFVDRRRDAGAAPWRQFAEGAALTVILTAAVAAAGARLERVAALPAVVLAASTLAARSLDDAVAAVERALARDDLTAARANLAHIVGRDVDRLDASGVAAAALESLAEGFCDGVVAPLLWLRAGGLGGALAFKVVSTLDSIVGHTEAPHTWFGRAAARTDDVANFIPARIAAGLLALTALLSADRPFDARAAVETALRDAPRHRSPNAGWPEAALAGALRIRLGGDATYGGAVVVRPALGGAFRAPAVADLAAARGLVRRATLLLGGVVVLSAR